MELFIDNNHKLSAEIIVNRFGNSGSSGQIYQTVKEGYDAGLFELGIHGFDHVRHSQLAKSDQSAAFASAKSKLASLMNDPNLRLFVPPFNDFNSDTIKAMAENELDIFSTSYSSERTTANIYKSSNSFETDNSVIQLSEVIVIDEETSQQVKRRVYHVPFEVSILSLIEPRGSLTGQDLVDSVMSKAAAQIANTGFAVIVLHPQDIAPYNSATGTWSNSINESKFQAVKDIVSAVQARGYQFSHMSDVTPGRYSEPVEGATALASLSLNSIANVGWGGTVTVTGKLSDVETGNGIENAEITFDGTGGSDIAPVTTNPDGTFTAKGLAPSTVATGWKVQSHFAGDSNYLASNSLIKTYNTIAHSISITVSASKSSVPWSTVTSFTATVTDTTAGVPPGTAIEGLPVELDGTGVIDLTSPVQTGPDGKVTFTGAAPGSVGTGWTYQAHFAGDSLYKKKDSTIKSYSSSKHSVTLSLAVTKSGDPAGTTSTTVTPGASYRISGTLTDSTTKTQIASKTITFVADQPIAISDKVTNTNGFYSSWQSAPAATGNYNIQSQFAGDDLYNSRGSSTRTLTVQ
jgi:peptidoglycan/xylan/chitin deacetylase (PgdA/CDA1 family)